MSEPKLIYSGNANCSDRVDIILSDSVNNYKFIIICFSYTARDDISSATPFYIPVNLFKLYGCSYSFGAEGNICWASINLSGSDGKKIGTVGGIGGGYSPIVKRIYVM